MFEVDGHFVRTRGGKNYKFPDVIAETLDFDDVLIVRLEGNPSRKGNRNVYGLDLNATVLWQIPDRTHMNEHSPYVALYRSGSFVEAYNWDGTALKLHPRQGIVLNEGYISSEYTSRRPRPEKHYL